jgi:hypothetical protein
MVFLFVWESREHGKGRFSPFMLPCPSKVRPTRDRLLTKQKRYNRHSPPNDVL